MRASSSKTHCDSVLVKVNSAQHLKMIIEEESENRFTTKQQQTVHRQVEVGARSHQCHATSPLNASNCHCRASTGASLKAPQALAIVAGGAILLIINILLFSSQSLANCQVTTAAATTTLEPPPKSPTSPPREPTIEQPATTMTPEMFGGDPNLHLNNVSAPTKLKPVNFTLVDEVFEAVLSEDEVVKRWKFMDSQLQDGMKSILKMLFPQIVSLSQDAKGSLTMFGNYKQCLSIRAPDEDEIEITDQFEEYFRGQFCVIHLKPWMPIKRPFYHLNSTIESLIRKNYKYYEKTLYDELAEIAIAFNFLDIRMDLCVPSTCTIADIQRVAELLSKKLEMRAKVMRCDIAPREATSFSSIDRATICWVALPLAIAMLSIFSTILLTLSRRQDPNRSGDQTSDRNAGRSNEQKVDNILECLAASGAFRERLMMPGNSLTGEESELELSDQPTERRGSVNPHWKPLPLYGIRNIFVFWFIVVQMTMELKYQYLRESLILRDMIMSYWPFQIIVNSTLLFESLILVTAFTYSYTCLESSLKDLIGYIVDKYIRLIFSIVTLIALTIITPLLAVESPVWRNFVEEQSVICQSNGYVNLFFLQNFIPYDKICLPHTWLFCVELQLIVLSIPLLLLLKKAFVSIEDSIIIGKNENNGSCKSICLLKTTFSKLLCTKAGLSLAILTTIGFFINFFTVYTNQLPASWFYTFPDVAQKNNYFSQYLTRTWTHLSVFLIGLISGHLCRAILQLRNINLLKSNQQPMQQPSPRSVSNSTMTLNSRQGSTSTIMAMEISSQTDDNSSAQSTCRKAKKHRQLLRVSFQIGAAVCMLAIIFSTYSWSTKEAPSVLVAALYDAGSRVVWSLALVGIMIQLCLPDSTNGKYSSAARFLSHPLFTFFGRLSFLAYLISPYIHTFVLAVEEQSLFPSLFIIFHVIVGNIVITYTVAFILSIVIEQPIRRLVTRFVLSKRLCKQKVNISTYYTNSAGAIPTLPTKPSS